MWYKKKTGFDVVDIAILIALELISYLETVLNLQNSLSYLKVQKHRRIEYYARIEEFQNTRSTTNVYNYIYCKLNITYEAIFHKYNVKLYQTER